MKTSISAGKRGIQWTAQNQLDDLDFANDLALLSHTHEQMQMKTVYQQSLHHVYIDRRTVDHISTTDPQLYGDIKELLSHYGTAE
ncbi:unnamed protein product [Schistosoma margrebowiei]|uniref:Uncharacterized protein n=1 Tax=Schistosoma margrebowiei TaxID=48269 RepID=A0A183LT50_9TREM|nr:unnamed protein product [Schistosoma margrebowiei]